MAPMEAKVKYTPSGDTLVLHNVRNPAQERTLSLAFVTAPRLRREGDETGAFESRDFLRQQTVGKVVRFKVLYNIPSPSPRDYGTVQLQSGDQLPDLLVREGWVKLRDDAGKKEDSPEGVELLEKLQTLQEKAKSEGKGLWSTSLKRIENVSELPDPKTFVGANKNKPIEAVVERVLSGDRLICRLLVEPSKHIQTLVLVAGIRAPTTKRINPTDSTEQAAEPYGPEAQAFVESRLYHRTVKIHPLGVSPQNQLVAQVIHPVGNIAEFVLKEGLARCSDHHSTWLGAEMGKLRQAERTARDGQKGLFKAAAPRAGASGESEAIVGRVFSADTLFLRNKAGAERRINLSSVRQPKPTDPAQAPFVPEAKEFLRKKLIGKHVKFHIDGKRPATEGYDEREMATVTFGGKNVGLTLVEAGYASVIRHKMDDTDRSPIYDELLAAEEAAKTEGKGMWNPKPPKKTEYVDYSASLDQAKRQMTLFARQRRVPAIVDFVKSGSRFTLLVPRENAKLTLVISGISCPKSARNATDKGEPFGQEAHDFASRRCMQRDVEIDVENIDKVGGFIGTMYVNRESFAKSLVEEGLASVHQYSAEKTGNANELNAAEQRAKEARKGMWHSWDPSQDAAHDGDETHTNGTNGVNGDSSSSAAVPTERRKDYRDVIVTHIDPATARLKLQQVGTGTAALTELMSSFRNFHLASTANLPGPPKAGDFVSAKFSEDDTWYRARVRRNDRDAKIAEVVYFDYGNAENVPWARLRPLDADKFGVNKLKPQAVDAALSFVQFSASPEYLKEAVYGIEDMTAGRQLVANVDAVDKDGTLFVTLFDPKKSDKVDQSVNAEVVAEGLGMVPRKLKAWERGATDVLVGLRKREGEARGEKRGMWEYGDLTED